MHKQAQTFYDILGVSPGASQAEIRSAYLRLIKRYHPDLSRPGLTERDIATLLNRCYATLKDPVARSHYDANLRTSPPHQAAGRVHSRQNTQLRPHQGTGPVVVIAAVAGVVALALWLSSAQSPGGIASVMGWTLDYGTDRPRNGVPVPGRDHARHLADRARVSSFPTAERFSRGCFASARRGNDPRQFDSCVLFDLAFIFWRPTNEWNSSSYFASAVVSYRHHDALSDIAGDPEERLGRLRESAFAGLLDGVRYNQKVYSPVDHAPSPTSPSTDVVPPVANPAGVSVPNWETNQ